MISILVNYYFPYFLFDKLQNSILQFRLEAGKPRIIIFILKKTNTEPLSLEKHIFHLIIRKTIHLIVVILESSKMYNRFYVISL